MCAKLSFMTKSVIKQLRETGSVSMEIQFMYVYLYTNKLCYILANFELADVHIWLIKGHIFVHHSDENRPDEKTDKTHPD